MRERPYTIICVAMQPLANDCGSLPTLQLGRPGPRRHTRRHCWSPRRDTLKLRVKNTLRGVGSDALRCRSMKPRVNLRLDASLLARLEAAAQEQKTTKTYILEEALRCYLDPDRSRSLEDRLMQRMEGFERRLGRLSWAVDLSVETVAHFVLYWLTRTDPIPEHERETAHALGQRRFGPVTLSFRP